MIAPPIVKIGNTFHWKLRHRCWDLISVGRFVH